jgi:hypothetical protein
MSITFNDLQNYFADVANEQVIDNWCEEVLNKGGGKSGGGGKVKIPKIKIPKVKVKKPKVAKAPKTAKGSQTQKQAQSAYDAASALPDGKAKSAALMKAVKQFPLYAKMTPAQQKATVKEAKETGIGNA